MRARLPVLLTKGALFPAVLVRARTDLSDSRNLIIVSVILVLGIGGMQFSIGSFTLGGIGLAGLVGIILNLVLPKKKTEEEAG